MKIIYLGAKQIGYECLKTLMNLCRTDGHELVAVFSNSRGKEVAKLATDNDIQIFDSLDPLLELENIDFIISVQYDKILRQKHLRKARILALNLHMAPLPEYRGCNQFTMAIINNDNCFGVTIHKMDEGVDTGSILFERRFTIPKDCFVEDLYELSVKESIILFRESMPLILSEKYNETTQESLIPSRGTNTYFRNDIESLKELNLDWPSEKLVRYIRATSMPGFNPPYVKLPNGLLEFNYIRKI